ncbi:MAG: hypothetical protein MJ074_10365 [Oscillospiraceae bacterium]|nr:hypothetical protein [Oscillospiraceae bacterium]
MNEMLSVFEMAGGDIRRRVDEAMAEVIRNCMDLRTEAAKDRKIILTIKVRPDRTRTSVSVSADVNTRLAPDAPAETGLSILTGDEGVVMIVEDVPDIPGQMGFDAPTKMMRLREA